MSDVDPVTPGDDAIEKAAQQRYQMDSNGDCLPLERYRQIIAAAAPLLVAEAVAAERAKTANALAAMKRERDALRRLSGPDGSQSIWGYTKCIELLESALFAAGSETTKEDD